MKSEKPVFTSLFISVRLWFASLGTALTTGGIKRASPPQAVQKVRESVYLIQVSLSESPSADWRRLFYDTQGETPPEFPPRSVEISGVFLRFRSDATGVEQKTTWIDRWIERANQKEAALGGRSEEQRRRREEVARESQELAELNARWAKL
jgi:hypothetical protein